MPFKGTEGKKITLSKARAMIGSHRKSKAFTSGTKLTKVKGGFYGKKMLLKILNQPNCIGIRYYHAVNAKKQQTIVLVGENRQGKLLTRTMINDGPLCPPFCDLSGDLGM